MKKLILATTAVAAIAAGTAAAEARIHCGQRLSYGYDTPSYSPVEYTYAPKCHYVTVQKIVWVDGYQVVKYVQKKVCNSY